MKTKVTIRTVNRLLNLVSTYVEKRHNRSTVILEITVHLKTFKNRGKIYNFKNPAISNHRVRQLIK